MAFISKVNICSCNRIPTLLVVLVLVTNPVIVVYRKLAQSNISIIFLTWSSVACVPGKIVELGWTYFLGWYFDWHKWKGRFFLSENFSCNEPLMKSSYASFLYVHEGSKSSNMRHSFTVHVLGLGTNCVFDSH